MSIKAITFDLWGTILHNKTLLIHKKLTNYICDELGQSYFDRMYVTNITKEQFLNDFKNFAGYSKMRKAKRMLEDQSTNFKVYSDIKSVLDLKDKYKLGIISNASFRTNEILKNLNATKIFDQIIISYKVGIIKPNKKIFEYASKKLGCELNEMLHIGNDYNADFLGAKNAGCNALLLDRNRKYKDIKERIRSFKYLDNYLERLI